MAEANLESETEETFPKSNKRQKKSDKIDDCLLSYFQQQTTETKDENNADLFFLKSLLPDLMALTDENKLVFKCEMIQLLDD